MNNKETVIEFLLNVINNNLPDDLSKQEICENIKKELKNVIPSDHMMDGDTLRAVDINDILKRINDLEKNESHKDSSNWEHNRKLL